MPCDCAVWAYVWRGGSIQRSRGVRSLLHRYALAAIIKHTSPLYTDDLPPQNTDHTKDTADVVAQQNKAAGIACAGS